MHGIDFPCVIVVIIELFCRLLEQQERQPDFWFRERRHDMWRENKLAVSEFLGSKPDNLVFVHNATAGCYLLSAIGGATPKFSGGPNPSLHLSPSFPFTFSSPLPFPSIPLEVGPLNRGRSLGHCKLRQRGLGPSPSRKLIWCILALKFDIWRHQFY